MIVRVACASCGTWHMANARAAYLGIRCRHCQSLVRTDRTRDAVRGPADRRTLLVGAGLVATALVSFLGLWRVLSLGSDGGGHRQQPPPSIVRAESLAADVAPRVVQDHYGGGVDITWRFLGTPRFDEASHLWSLPLEISWLERNSAGLATVYNLLPTEDAEGLRLSVQGDVTVGAESVAYRWSVRPNGESGQLQALLGFSRTIGAGDP